jgi:DNA-binding CsgD family transcriptional regulator
MNGPLKENFGEPHKKFFKSMLPHLERSLEIYARFERSESEKEALAQTLDRLTIGTVFLDARGRVVDTNEVARRILCGNDGLSLVNQRLVTRSPRKNAELVSLVDKALAGRDGRSRENFVGVLKTESSKGLCINLLVRTILPRGPFQSDVSPRVVVYLEESSRKQPAPSERLLAQLFGLTTSEAFLASLLASGVTLSDAAIKLGTTQGTVRTNVKRIFAKTGVNRQADLVGLILKSVAALA